LAETGVGGLSVIHPEVQNDKIVYVSDVLLELTTVTKIDISEIKKFLESLSSVCHIKSFTTDQYQSTQLRQEAIINHVADKVELFSVIKTTEPYETLSRIVQNKQFFIGNCPRLKSQMANVQVSNDNKIYKPEGISVGHYDTLDAVVGAVVQCVYDLDKHITHDVKEWYKAVEKDTTEFSLEGFDKI
jgi:phage terminase large subunit-like protein